MQTNNNTLPVKSQSISGFSPIFCHLFQISSPTEPPMYSLVDEWFEKVLTFSKVTGGICAGKRREFQKSMKWRKIWVGNMLSLFLSLYLKHNERKKNEMYN